MKSLFRVLSLLFLLVGICQAQNTQLTGKLTGPDASAFNGYLKLALEQQGASISPNCSTYGAPSQVLPNVTVTVQIQNSNLVNAPKVWGADCLLPNNIPYKVLVQDIYGNTLYQDEWLILGSTFDVGTAVSVYNPNIWTGIVSITGAQSKVTGGVNFTGPGVTQNGQTFTFTGTGGGGGGGSGEFLINELNFAGLNLAARLQAACASLLGVGGTVYIPSLETSSDSVFTSLPLGCIVDDQRNTIYPTQNGYTYFNPPSAGELYNSVWNDPSPSNTSFRHYQTLQIAGEAIGGGLNTYSGSGGVKSTFTTLAMNIFASTPGQKIMNNWQISNFSPGDTIFLGAQIYDTSWTSAAGDESVKASSIYITTGATPLTGTIASINGSTMTVTCTPTSNVSCGQMGEQQIIVNTSRGVQNTGTATITRNNPPIVTITGGSVTCPGGTNPCSSNTPGGVGLFFEFPAEVHSGIHIVMPVIAVDPTGTQLTLLIQFRQTAGGVPTNSNWQGYTTSGAYAVYQGSMITAVPYQAAVYTSPQATVASITPFQVGDTIMVPGGNNRNSDGHTILNIPNVPCPSNGGCVSFDANSGGYYPMTYGFSATGNYQNAPFRATWVGYSTPIWGVNLYGAPPSNGYFEGADFTTLTSTEHMLCGGTHVSGANTCINLYRTAGAMQDFWQIPNTEFTNNVQIDGQVLTGLNVVGGVSVTTKIATPSGGQGLWGNLGLCSYFQSGCISNWHVPFSGYLPATVTPNVGVDLYGNTTVEEITTDSSAAPAHLEGQQQGVNISPAVSTNYVFSGYVYTDGVAPASHVIMSLYSGGTCFPSLFSNTFNVTTSLTRYSMYCTIPPGSVTISPTFISDQPNVHLYIWCAQVEIGTVPGACLRTDATAITPSLGEAYEGVVWHTPPNNATFNSVTATTLQVGAGPVLLSALTGAHPCNSTLSGSTATISDPSATPTYWTIAAGTGSAGATSAPVYCDGANWRYY